MNIISIDIVHSEVWRVVNTIECVGIMCSLALISRWAHVDKEKFDYFFRMVTLAASFGCIAYASQAALRRGIPPQDYNFYASIVFFFTWVGLMTPWRWSWGRIKLRPKEETR